LINIHVIKRFVSVLNLESLIIFAKAKWLVDFSQPKGLKYKDNYVFTEVNQPKEMQKLSKNLNPILRI